MLHWAWHGTGFPDHRYKLHRERWYDVGDPDYVVLHKIWYGTGAPDHGYKLHWAWYGTGFPDHRYKLHWERWYGVGDPDYIPGVHGEGQAAIPLKAGEKRWAGANLGVTEADLRFRDRMGKRQRK